MKQYIHRRQWQNFFMVWIFILGILSNINGVETALPVSFENHTEQQMQQNHAGGKEEPAISAVQFLRGVDDFQIMTAAPNEVSPTMEEATGETTVLSLTAVWAVLFRNIILEKSSLRCTENGRAVFRVVAFIHQMDGKKKNPVLNYCVGQNRRYQDGSWNKIQNFIY